MAVVVLLAASTFGAEPGDPRQLYHCSEEPPAAPRTVLAPVQASLGVPRALPPAPAVERAVAPRAAAVPRTIRVAIGITAHGLGAPAPARAIGDGDGDVVVAESRVAERDAIELMQLARTDFALVAAALSANDQRAGLRQTLLGVELFALVVPQQIPLQGLDRDQVRRLLTGQLRDWSELGMPPGPIAVAAPGDAALRERAARALIPGDRIADEVTGVNGDRGVYELLLREPRTIGLVRAAGATTDPRVRVLPIDRIRPGYDAFVYGTYPYGTGLWLVTHGAAQGAAERYLAALRGPQPLDAGVFTLR